MILADERGRVKLPPRSSPLSEGSPNRRSPFAFPGFGGDFKEIHSDRHIFSLRILPVPGKVIFSSPAVRRKIPDPPPRYREDPHPDPTPLVQARVDVGGPFKGVGIIEDLAELHGIPRPDGGVH